VVLAAGRARRMGKLKQLLPWGDTTVLGETLRQVRAAGYDDVLVVTGHRSQQVAAEARRHGAAAIINPRYDEGEMLSSLQAAVRELLRRQTPPAAVLVVLGDQPLVPPEVYRRLRRAFVQGEGMLIAPLYQGRRGNPVLIGAAHFAEVLALPAGSAPRALLRRHAAELVLVPVEARGVLVDLDRPEQYEQYRPDSGDDS
jgi:molybdenum cofactor cytidylyltransferase